MYERTVPAVDEQAAAWAPDLRDEVLRRRADGAGRIEIPLDIRDAHGVLSAWRKADVLFYWASRSQSEIVVATGIADRFFVDGARTEADIVEALTEVEGRAAHGERYYGGLRFDPFVESDAEWKPYGTVSFFKPRFEVRIGRESAVMLVNGGSSDELARAMVGWSFDDRRSNGHALSVTRGAEYPDREDWIEAVEETLCTIRRGDVEKAVLARAVDLQAAHDVDAVDLLGKLIDTAPFCYHMLFRPEPGTAFVCATPERLIRRRGRQLRSEAVAGTRPLSVSVEDDARLLDDLLTSDKDRREHEVVGRSIVEALGRYASHIDIARRPSEMRLATGRHLKSGIRAELLPTASTAEIITAIHPTPAVGGYPTEAARQWLRDTEPFDRGWYAGAVGWIGDDEAELAVGIRSALVQGRDVRLYSGAGIVEGSQPEAEWDEIEQKLDGFLKVLRIPG